MSATSTEPIPLRQQRLTTTTQPAYYVPIPTRLVRDMGRNRLAVGLYALIGRLWRTQANTDGWVTLSTNDIGLYDPSLSRGAILRALAKLQRYDWVEAQQGRYKKRFRPTWGHIKGAIQPWQASTPNLGRPKHVATIRLDQQLLDSYIGRLTLRPTEPVVIDRYVAPMVTLEDVGAYASTLAGYPQPTDTLRRLGLVVDDGAVAIPALATVLGQAAEVTQRGIQRLGWAPISDPQPPPAPDPRPAVFFVAPTMASTMIRTMTRTMIGCAQHQEEQNIPAGRHESALAATPPDMTWMAWSTWTSRINPQSPIQGLMGGFVQGTIEQPNEDANQAQNPNPETDCRRRAGLVKKVDIKTETEQALMDAGVWSRTARTFREAPMMAVRYALERAREAQARDIPAYAIGLLGNLRDRQWQLPLPIPAETLDTTKYTTEAYANFLRDPGAMAAAAPAPAVPDAPAPAELTPAMLWQAVQAALRGLMTPAVYQATVAQAALAQCDGGVVILTVPTNTVRQALLDRWMAVLNRTFAEVLNVPTVQLVIQLGAAASAVRPVAAPPALVPNEEPTVAPVPVVQQPPPPAALAPEPAVGDLPETLAALLPALQQQLRRRALQRQEPALGVLASALQAVTVERETPDGLVALTPAVPTALWRPEGGDLVVLTIGQSQYLQDLAEGYRALLADEVGSLVDRRLTAADMVVRQQARGRPRRT